jgi:RNA polymerase sigma factor (sigma-70 family)
MTGDPAEALEALVSRARAGDRDALERLVSRIQDRVYALARRMLWDAEDARDAAQEILVRIVTHLGTYRGESAFSTWVYRVAANHLLSVRRSRIESMEMDWKRFGADLEAGLSDDAAPGIGGAEAALLLEEIKIGCTLAMLTCLDRAHRLAYVLGEILEMDHAEGARVLEITPAAFRKRLQRARGEVVAFTSAHCGLVAPDRPCRCRRRVRQAVATGRADPARLAFATDPDTARRFPEVLAEIRRLEKTRRAAALLRSHPEMKAPPALAEGLRQLLDTGAVRANE